MPSTSNNRKAIALIVLVFVLGVALGAVGHTFFDRHVLGARPQTPPRGVARLTKELNLTPDQQKQIGEILADMQHRFDALHQQMSPQFDQIREQGHDQIRQILTPEQRPKFEDLLKQFAEDRRHRNAGSNPHH
jgi:Spy/CpxP family protein refolding chaperone